MSNDYDYRELSAIQSDLLQTVADACTGKKTDPSSQKNTLDILRQQNKEAEVKKMEGLETFFKNRSEGGAK